MLDTTILPIFTSYTEIVSFCVVEISVFQLQHRQTLIFLSMLYLVMVFYFCNTLTSSVKSPFNINLQRHFG